MEAASSARVQGSGVDERLETTLETLASGGDDKLRSTDSSGSVAASGVAEPDKGGREGMSSMSSGATVLGSRLAAATLACLTGG
jgi:hypothetical protein